ncbi:MAG: hypothetical protein P8R54_17590 [Myxococcota bacterium]|nr:hypothetical protein [Myxococcota bacterium]
MVALLLACTHAEEASSVDTAPPPLLSEDIFEDACEAELQRQLPPFDVHFSVVTDHPDAPIQSAESITDCPPGDTRWPCSHITALTETFITEAGDPVCDLEHPEQCVTFRYKSHRFFDDIEDSSGCQNVIRAGRGIRTPLTHSGTAIADLRAATQGCTDSEIIDPYALNLLVFDNSVSGIGTSFATAYTSRWSAGCAPYVYIEVSRLPATPGEEFLYEVNQHEFGHIFGLGHTCLGIDEAPYPDSNIMQGTGSSCCCECGPDLNIDPESIWATQVCYDCSAVTPSDRCDERPGGQCGEPECTANVSNGNRNLGFSDAQIGNLSSGEGQISTILERARGQHACWCRAALAQGHRRWTVSGEATCRPGAGVFRLQQLDPKRPEHLTPLRVSGDPLTPLASVVFSGTAGDEVALSWTCPATAADTFTSHRPEVAYRLPLSALGSDLADSLTLRLDTSRALLWVELSGQPGEFRVLRLHGTAMRWQWPGPGRQLSGTLRAVEGALELTLSSGERLKAVEIPKKFD